MIALSGANPAKAKKSAEVGNRDKALSSSVKQTNERFVTKNREKKGYSLIGKASCS